VDHIVIRVPKGWFYIAPISILNVTKAQVECPLPSCCLLSVDLVEIRRYIFYETAIEVPDYKRRGIRCNVF